MLGGGFAGSYVARLLGKRGATIVSLENFMLFTPLLPEAASGTLEPRHVVVPLRVMCPHSELLLGRLTALDTRRKTATVVAGTDTLAIQYGDAVLALGSFARSLPIPGLAEHGLGFKDLADAIHLRNHVLRQLELAAAERDRQRAEAHLTFVFVGAGYAGVEALAELSDLVRDAMRYYPEFQRPKTRWILVDAAPKILPEIPSRLGDYAAEQLAGRGVEIHTSTTLASVGPGTVALSGGLRIAAHTLVWTAGVRPNPVLRDPRRSRPTTAEPSRSTPRSESRATTASGRSATAPASRTSARPAGPIRPPRSTRCARPAASPRICAET